MIARLLATALTVAGVTVPRTYVTPNLARPIPVVAVVPDRLELPSVPVVVVDINRAPQVIVATPAEPQPQPAPPAYEAAVATALAQLGKRYVWAQRGPDTFDCSGLMQFAWASAGIDIPNDTYAQWRGLDHVSIDELQPGDLIFTTSLGHVYMYVGDGQVIHAPGTGQRVKLAPMPTRGIRQEVARPA